MSIDTRQSLVAWVSILFLFAVFTLFPRWSGVATLAMLALYGGRRLARRRWSGGSDKAGRP